MHQSMAHLTLVDLFCVFKLRCSYEPWHIGKNHTKSNEYSKDGE